MEWNTFSTQEKCQDGFETDEQADELGGPGGRSDNQVFASASLILAILSVISFLVFFISIPLGALAIVFALLSRGDGLMQARARISIILSAIALAASIFLTSYAVYQIVTNPLLQSEFEAAIESYYGEDFFLPDQYSGGLIENLPSPYSGGMTDDMPNPYSGDVTDGLPGIYSGDVPGGMPGFYSGDVTDGLPSDAAFSGEGGVPA